MSVVKKRKHVSKKNKKAWRKYCDIQDVEDFLEEQRLDERLGKFDTKPDSELFVVDTGGDKENEEQDVKPLSAKAKKRAKLSAPPKCFEILIPNSKVQDPNKKRNHVNPIGTKPTAFSKITEKRRFEKGVYQKKLDVSRKNRKLMLEQKRKAKNSRHTFDSDAWSSEAVANKGIPSSLCGEFTSTEAQLHNVLPDQRIRKKPPLPSTLNRPAVEVPHPGVSYNPSYQEHQDLLKNVVDHELGMMKKEQHLHRVTTNLFSKTTREEKEQQWLEEVSFDLPRPHNPATDPTPDDSDNEYKAINPPVKDKRKDHKARRKQKERLLELERQRRLKVEKKKITDLYKLRKLEASIKKREQQQKELKKKRQEKRATLAATAPPALNKNKVPLPEPEFVDPKTLSGDLRNVTSSSNLLRERYESLQRRGALAPAKIMMKKKRKVKSYFKPGHKVTDQDIEKYIKRSEERKQKAKLRKAIKNDT